ncbi:hypothetical protein R69619_00386 [Paraburkholderia nemoris]|uniref:hypothetical protein n=1 Tax=Paraburkholderia nemoris TaxID=2793076 RepID=UPI00190B716B|nr:hypothetical protein [Paraburkholderia nemoris]MBK3737651.1 hypothetical protein [Paraburkholderia aspalathi]CAE6693976.1 hypothetical protein R69619_00386 [Paraburkholderia nemoris]
MANPVLRRNILELLADDDMTAAAIGDELGALRNSVDKALVRAREERKIHVCGYAARTAAIYRLGPGVDVARPVAPDPVVPAEERHDAINACDAKVHDVQMPVYFELAGGLLPGVRHFACSKLRATMSVEACSGRWHKANSTDVDADRMNTCKHCATGAQHSGRANHNPSKLRGMTICGRCHTGVARLIGKHLCVSCYNRQREYLIGKNAKGTAPIKLAKLEPRRIRYMAGKAPKTLYMPLTVDTEELVISALRDSKDKVRFGCYNAAMDWFLDDGHFDRSLPADVESVQAVIAANVPDIADNVHGVQERVVVPIAASLSADVSVASFQALRDAVEQFERDVPAPTVSSRRVARRQRQAARQVRASNVTLQLMRAIGVLPFPAPVVVSVLTPFYAASLFAD